MITLDQALDRLLHDSRYLTAFLSNDQSALQLNEHDLDALQTIDREQLLRAHRGVRAQVLRRSHRGCGSITTLFPETLASWTEAHPTDERLESLSASFLASPAFQAHHEVAFSGAGQCVEEAFYRFAEQVNIGDPAVREREFLHAMARALTMSPTPAFRVPPELRRDGDAWVGVTRRSGPTLFAATPKGLVTGPLR